MEEHHCRFCDYTTTKLSNWKKHQNTNKHKKNFQNKKYKNKEGLFVCDICNKSYKYINGLYKHRASHNNTSQELDSKNKEISNLYSLLEKTIAQNSETLEKILPKIGNITNNINNRMTINVFLNDYCKDAMNINEFIKNINLSLEDINYTGRHGYANGIGNIFVKSLSELPATERPIHCCDQKTGQFYVKNDNTWKEDVKNEKIHKGISDISIKQTKAIKMWETQYPNWTEDEELTNQYINIVQQVTKCDNNEQDLEDICKMIGSGTDVTQAITMTEQNTITSC